MDFRKKTNVFRKKTKNDVKIVSTLASSFKQINFLIMKKVLSLVVLFAITALVSSCSKSERAPRLEGRWEYQRIGFLVNETTNWDPWDHAPGCARDFIEILEGGAYRDVLHDNFEGACESEVTTGTWTRSGNNMTIVLGGVTYQAVIVTLNDSTLEVRLTSQEETEVFEFIRRI